jgi:hypothetical protein
MNRRPAKRNSSSTQSAAQQAVLNKLRSGGTIQGAQPNNPFVNLTRFFDPRKTSIPDLKSGMVGGREALVAPGGWNQDTAGLGEITVGGQRFFPAQSGKDLVYQRAPGQIGGQYGSIRVPDQLASSIGDVGVDPASRAYQQELSRTAQLTAQDPELQRYEQRREAAKTQEEMNAVRDIGMEIWAKKYGGEKGLASRVKPGQVGYDVIQKTLYPQGSPLPPLPEDSLAMLNAIAPTNAQGIRENVTPTLGQMPVFGDASEAMYQAVTNGGTLVTPMLSPQSKTTQQETAQLLADTYKSSFLGDDEFAKRLRAMDPYMQ